MDAVSALHLSIETPDSRFADFTKVGAPSLIADTACASFLTLGPPVDERWRKVDLATHKVAGWKNGTVASEGSGAAVLGDPCIALTWLVNEVARYGGGIRAGEFVTTGTCIRPIPIAPGDAVVADYGELGTLSATYR
jgi:2-keto-4-pentenoate hydratase